MAITLAKQGHNPELCLKKIGFEVDEMVQHVKSWVKDSIHSWLMLLLCKRHVYRCMTLTLLPSCCTPNPWWNSMCLKWRTYLPLNEWLQRLNFTRLKEYQLAAWMPSEKKKIRQGIWFPWRRGSKSFSHIPPAPDQCQSSSSSLLWVQREHRLITGVLSQGVDSARGCCRAVRSCLAL